MSMNLTILLSLKSHEPQKKEIINFLNFSKIQKYQVIFLAEKKHSILNIVEEVKKESEFNSKTLLCQQTGKKSKNSLSKKTNRKKDNCLDNLSNVFKLIIYPNGTSEEAMIEDGFSFVNDNVFLIRDDCLDWNLDLFQQIILKGFSGADIVMPKQSKKSSKLKTWFKNKIKSIYKSLFNFNFYSGDISLQFFSFKAVEIMKSTSITNLSKLNKWYQMNVDFVENNTPHYKHKNISFNKLKLQLVIYCLLIPLLIVGTCFLAISFKLPFYVWLAVIMIYILILGLIALTSLRIYTLKRIGNIKFIEEKHIQVIEFYFN